MAYIYCARYEALFLLHTVDCSFDLLSVGRVLQEVEILNADNSSDMGIVLLDVKGFRLLKKCAAALRARRGRR